MKIRQEKEAVETLKKFSTAAIQNLEKSLREAAAENSLELVSYKVTDAYVGRSIREISLEVTFKSKSTGELSVRSGRVSFRGDDVSELSIY